MLRDVGGGGDPEDLGDVMKRRMTFASGTRTSVATSTMAQSVCWSPSESMATVSGPRNRRDGADPDAGRRAAAQQGRAQPRPILVGT